MSSEPKTREEGLLPGTDDRARIERTLAALDQRGVHAIFVPDRRSARETVLGLIPPGSSVAHGKSTSLEEIGVVQQFSHPESGYRYMNAEWTAENDAVLRGRLRARLSLEADYFLGGVQAICETGEVIGADMSGSRQAFYIYGPRHVIWVAGVNKLVANVDEGMRRLREVALPLEDQRMKHAGGTGSFVGVLVIYEHARPGRRTLVLVNEDLGF